MGGPGAVLGGRYTLVERIGGGGMGTVWRADDAVLARSVAVKILHSALFEDDTFIQRFRREAQLVAAIDHPAVVDVHDYGESGGSGDAGEGDASDKGGEAGGDDGERCAYIVMELVDGRPLDRVLAAEGPMPPERALDLVAAALDGLHAAHRREIVHRDLKPSNLMVRSDGRMVITDFGIARAIASTKITASHAIVGTALYMAPEQAEGAGTGPASDLYSIGVVCYELLTGTPPFVGEGVLEVALKHVRQPVPELPGTFPAAVRELVAKALAKKPEDRYADAAEMAAAARAAIGSAGAAGVAGAAGTPADSGTVDLRAGAGGAPGPAVVAGGAAGGGAGSAGEEKPGASVPVADVADRPGPDEVAKVEPQAATEPGKRRSRRTLLVPVIVPLVISMGTATVLLVDRTPDHSDAAVPPAAQTTVVVTAPAAPGTPSASATTPPATPVPTDTPAATQVPAADQQTGAPNQPGAPAPGTVPGSAQGGNGASAGRGSGTGTGTGTGAGAGAAAGGNAAGGGSAGGASGGQANPPGTGAGAGGTANQPANSNPQPPAQNAAGGSPAGGGSPSGGGPPSGGGNPPAPQTPARPPSCGGTSWSTIISVKDGHPIGMAHDDLSGDNPIVVGGASQYGWVRATNPGSWILFNACNSGGPQLVQTMDGKVTLSGGFSFLTNWTVRNGSAQGSYTLADYQNQSCMTDNGVGNAVTMVTCTPGNAAQEWRFQ
ncbi:protein kinase [Kitasatospora sp. NPDC087861]|uniref:serine/threonine-protein kinase n=1 Tax=Kitasatospora sp. NPDC087861 TaxID=3364070 RepID=UPI00381684F1